MQPKRLLIVDDEPNVATVLAASLENLGGEYVVDVAHSGGEALDKMQQTHYALVLTDYRMPGLNGLELTRAVRQISPNTMIVLMTAFGTEQLQDTLQNIGVDGYVDKPFTMAEIKEIVTQALQRTANQDPRQSQIPDLDQAVYEHVRALRTNTGAHCVLLLSSDGYPIEVAGATSEVDVVSLSALVAANFVAGAEVARLLGGGSVFKSSYHEGPDYNIYSYDVNGELLLAVIFGPESRAGVVWLYTKRAAAELVPLIQNQSPVADYADDLIAAVDEGLDHLFDVEDNDPGEGQLMSFEEAINKGLLPPGLLVQSPSDDTRDSAGQIHRQDE